MWRQRDQELQLQRMEEEQLRAKRQMEVRRQMEEQEFEAEMERKQKEKERLVMEQQLAEELDTLRKAREQQKEELDAQEREWRRCGVHVCAHQRICFGRVFARRRLRRSKNRTGRRKSKVRRLQDQMCKNS